jgi:Resolvase, N terminal domain
MRHSGKTSEKRYSGRLIGYARVPTDEQGTDPQRDKLRATGCDTILEEQASGAERTRPVLARLLREIRSGETLVVVRLDRLAHPVSNCACSNACQWSDSRPPGLRSRSAIGVQLTGRWETTSSIKYSAPRPLLPGLPRDSKLAGHPGCRAILGPSSWEFTWIW